MPKQSPWSYLMWAALFACANWCSVAVAADPATFPQLEREYQASTKGLLQQFCLKCHSTEQQAGELDLERFATVAAIRKETSPWLKVVEMLDNGEMPPKDARAMTPQQRQQLRDWVERLLHAEALANAGDPGPVVLRRLSNAEYTYTIRDLTRIGTLHPTREFPADGAAGEGFTNTGNALAMSPSLLTKYFDAGKEIAQHAVLLPDGFRFSPHETRSDWTNDTLADIRSFYRQFTGAGTGTQVNLQGVIFETNGDGLLPLEVYLKATILCREDVLAGRKTLAEVAQAQQLNEKYLGILWKTLNDPQPSLILYPLRAKWRVATPETLPALLQDFKDWQQSLFRFSSVGHIGKKDGPLAWQEPVTPLVSRQDLRVKFAPKPGEKEITVTMWTGDAGDGREHDFVVWERPRLVAPGRPELLLRDVREFTRVMTARREQLFAGTAHALAATAEARQATDGFEIAQLAQKHRVEPETLTAWLDYLGIGQQSSIKLTHFANTMKNSNNYAFVNGWGVPETPLIVANSSANAVRIPGHLKAHGVCIHPSPTLFAAVGWQSPVAATVRIAGQVQHAHPECGNGVTWAVELRRGATRVRLANGISHGSTPVAFGPFEGVVVRPGDLVSLLVGPRDGNHSCDLTDVELNITSPGENGREWSLTQDVSPDILAGNPHADRFGTPDVWHFYSEPVQGNEAGPSVPAGSLLARWQGAATAAEQAALATELQTLLLNGPVAGTADNHPDVLLHRQLAALGGPLFIAEWKRLQANPLPSAKGTPTAVAGLDPAVFGKHPDGSSIDPANLCVQAPYHLTFTLPVDLVEGAELVTSGTLHLPSGQEGSAQLLLTTEAINPQQGLLPAGTTATLANGVWTDDNRRLAFASPILVQEDSVARKRIEAAFAEFREVFPIALCYSKIVPVDEVVTLTLFHREDSALERLMLSREQAAQLDRMWDELHFISHDALTLVDAFQQLLEYASQDADPKVFEPMRGAIDARAAAFRKSLIAAEPKQLQALVTFAAQVYRRPLTKPEADEIHTLYRTLRETELPHEEAFRLVMARLFIAPAYLYRLEQAPAGTAAGPISDYELASRLSYFLWASMPDAELMAVAASGKLRDPEMLIAQSRRMARDPKVRRLATEFACQWLQIYEFDALDEKSERHFPTFNALRGEMYEESILFFEDLFRSDATVLSIFNADHSYLNENLARHYGIPNVTGPEMRRVEGLKQYGRGGILTHSTALAKQSGASRTSPILRGIWISEVLLGEKLPKPPKDVPQLPEDEADTELSVRQLVEKHTSDPRCATCHQRIDPFGFSLEGYDAIGRKRDKDLGDRPLDVRAEFRDGTTFEGVDGLREHLLSIRREAIVKQFCKKLLGYALAREVLLSDDPLLQEMQKKLEQNDYRISVAIESIVTSRQFREIRGRDAAVAVGE